MPTHKSAPGGAMGTDGERWAQLRTWVATEPARSAWLLATLVTGLLLLAGRYDWAPEMRQFSLRGYISSAYLFIVTALVIWLLSKVLMPRREAWSRGLTVAVAVFFSLPYRWLGLDRFFYYLERPLTYGAPDIAALPLFDGKPPVMNWLPEAWGRLADMPHEAAFFMGLIAVGILSALIFLERIRRHARRPAQDRKYVWLGLALYLLILLQTYLHLSLRSPYLYISYFTQPPESASLYVEYMYPNFQGAVNADLAVFSGLENHFWGVPGAHNTLLIRRAFPFYVSSQLSYFMGMYDAFVLLNVLSWFVALICAYLLGRRWCGREVGAYLTFFVATGPGFIMFVGQPMSYLISNALIVILIFLFVRLLGDRSLQGASTYLLMGLLLGLGALVYDYFTWYIFFVLYGLIRRRSWKGLLVSTGIGLGVYAGFLWIQTAVLRLVLDNDNSRLVIESIKNLYSLLVETRMLSIYAATLSFFGTYLNHLAHVVFVIPLVLALGGLFLIRGSPQLRVLGLLLLLPTIVGFAVLHYGGTTWESYLLSSLPRFNYPAYPAVYLLAAGMLAEGRRYLSRKGWGWPGTLVVCIILGLVLLLSNLDAFGGLPQLYYNVYFSSGGYFGQPPS